LSTITDSLRSKRSSILAAAKAIAEPAAAANRALTVEEQGRYEQHVADLDALDARLAQLDGQQFRQAETEAMFAQVEGRPVVRRSLDAADAGVADEFRSAILENNPKPIEVRDPSPRSGYQPGVEQRDLLKSTANLYPVSFYDRLVEHMVESSAVLQAGATLLTTDSGEDLRVPKSTALSTAAIVAEAGSIGESDPTLAVITLGAFKYGVYIEVSTELVQDSGFDLVGYLARETGQAIGLALGNHLINGNGTGQPRGVILDATVGETGAAAGGGLGAQGTGGQGTDHLNDLFASVIEPYARAASAAWLMRTLTLSTIRNLKTTAGELVGNQFAVPTSTAGAMAEMNGKPVFIDPFVPAIAGSAKSIIFGDWSRFFVRMVNGIRFERSDDFRFQNDLVSFRALLRADAALIDTSGAIKVFQGAA